MTLQRIEGAQSVELYPRGQRADVISFGVDLDTDMDALEAFFEAREYKTKRVGRTEVTFGGDNLEVSPPIRDEQHLRDLAALCLGGKIAGAPVEAITNYDGTIQIIDFRPEMLAGVAVDNAEGVVIAQTEPTR